MPVESVQPLLGRPLRTAALATPPRLRPKGPVGPEFYRQSPTAAERPRQSAVERLEADKAKYVKSPVALSKQQPIRPPVMRKPPATANNAAMRPTRKTPTTQNAQQGNVPFNLAHLSNLINDVNDVSAHLSTSSTVTSEDALASNCTTASTTTTRSFTSTDLDDAGRGEERPGPPPPGPDWSSPAKVRLKASGPSKAESPGSPAAATVRRVDVMPQARPARTTPPCRPPRYIRQPLQPMSLFPQSPLRPANSNQHLFYPRKSPGPSPLKPVSAPPKPDHPASSPGDASSPVDASSAPPPLPLPVLPPASPAITRLSSTSSRKRPSLSRSKSDMSERYSRAGTELERFFSLCGLDPSEMQDLTKASSDIVSLARFRSASAPGSECGGSDREEGGDNGGEDDGDVTERVPYGVSVIERNARVIKWLYGVRQAKDNTKVTNM